MSLIDTDWSAEWRRIQEERKRTDDSAYWDGRAPSFASSSKKSRYAESFLEYAAIQPDESVLDIGCGPGTLALPLARQGHAVTAVDFSRGMLEILDERAATEGLGNLTTIQASWEDDWQAAGVGIVDVAVASRSIAVTDLGRALHKLDSFARRRVCLTLSADGSPHDDPIAFKAIGRTIDGGSDFIYCLNILFQMGIKPEVRFIRSRKSDAFGSLEEARHAIRESISPVNDGEGVLLERFIDEHVIETTDKDGSSVWTRDYPRTVNWAFVSWDKDLAKIDSPEEDK